MKFLISHFIVHGSSMYPTLKEGKHIFSFNWFLKLKKGDIVVALVDDRAIIKRISEVKEGKYFLVGDNKSQSTDSRKFGPVSLGQIIGKVI